VKQKQDVFS